MRELCSTGKSGSFFYFSYDSKYLLKTIPEHEFLLFESMLKDYYNHMYNNKDTLLQRYYGLHIMIYNDLKLYFVVMNNVFNTKVKIQYKYDLKGSKYQRLSRDPSKNNYDDFDYSIPMKDLDFIDRKEKLNLNKSDADTIYQQAQLDGHFLASKNINDYSFLIGIHEISRLLYNKGGKNKEKNGSHHFPEILNFCIKDELYVGGEKNEIDEARKPFFESCKGGLLSKDSNFIYFFGIIDIFTNYG